jgi:hypothetical protein
MPQSPKSCGACSVCCKDLTFELEGALKPAGVMCQHCKVPNGCGIHETRPQICRAYFCGWHHLPSLDEDWRPEKSEILILFREGPAPDGLMDGIEFELIGSLDRIFWLPLVRYIATLIEDKAPVYLSIPGEIGFQSPWVYLSDIAVLRDAIARRDFAMTTSALSQALQVCIDFPKTKVPSG